MSKQTKTLVIAGLAVSLVMGGVISFWASSSPDGLEWVAGEQGFEGAATENETQKDISAMPDYEAPGVKNDFLKVSIAGVVGTLITFALALGLAWLLKRRKPAAAGQPEAA